jgi:hypothetical protein
MYDTAHLCTEAAVADGVGAPRPTELAGAVKLGDQGLQCASARLKQQLAALLQARDVGEHQCCVLVGVWLLPRAVQKPLQQHSPALMRMPFCDYPQHACQPALTQTFHLNTLAVNEQN